MAGLEKQMLNTAEKNVNILDDFQRDIVGRMNEQQDRDLSRQSALNEQILSFTGSQDQLVAGIAGMLSTQKQQNFDLNEELNKLVVRFGELASAHEHATKAMQESSSEMRVTSVQMNLMSSNGKEAAKHLGDSVEASVRILGETSAQNTAIAERYSVLTQQMEEVSGRLDGTVITMSGAAAKADEGMALVGAHFDTLGESLRTHVEELESQVARLLTDYAERVNNQTTNRLNVWNEQTNAYIGSMTAAISAIGDVVDEIDSRVGRAP
ncbi:MAG TPA: hypothetical protein DCX14_06390 [Flavobacteriales bacterium]|nr:hypothetical protein [Flavobacteriales bacterium]